MSRAVAYYRPPPPSCPPPPPRCRSQLIVNAQSDLSHWQRGRPLWTHVRRVWRGGGALYHMGGGTGGGGAVPSNFSAFNIMPMGVAWKESTSNGPRPPPPIVAPWRRPCTVPGEPCTALALCRVNRSPVVCRVPSHAAENGEFKYRCTYHLMSVVSWMEN